MTSQFSQELVGAFKQALREFIAETPAEDAPELDRYQKLGWSNSKDKPSPNDIMTISIKRQRHETDPTLDAETKNFVAFEKVDSENGKYNEMPVPYDTITGVVTGVKVYESAYSGNRTSLKIQIIISTENGAIRLMLGSSWTGMNVLGALVAADLSSPITMVFTPGNDEGADKSKTVMVSFPSLPNYSLMKSQGSPEATRQKVIELANALAVSNPNKMMEPSLSNTNDPSFILHTQATNGKTPVKPVSKRVANTSSTDYEDKYSVGLDGIPF